MPLVYVSISRAKALPIHRQFAELKRKKGHLRFAIDLHFVENDGFVSWARKRIAKIERDTQSEMCNYFGHKNKSDKSEEDNDADNENDEKCEE